MELMRWNEFCIPTLVPSCLPFGQEGSMPAVSLCQTLSTLQKTLTSVIDGNLEREWRMGAAPEHGQWTPGLFSAAFWTAGLQSENQQRG